MNAANNHEITKRNLPPLNSLTSKRSEQQAKKLSRLHDKIAKEGTFDETLTRKTIDKVTNCERTEQ